VLQYGFYSSSYPSGPLGALPLVFPKAPLRVGADTTPSTANATMPPIENWKDICAPCKNGEEFTLETDISYFDVDVVVPHYIDMDQPTCVERCDNDPSCKAYRWQSTDLQIECYLISRIGHRRVAPKGTSGRRCFLMNECDPPEKLVVLSKRENIGWMVDDAIRPIELDYPDNDNLHLFSS